MCVCGCVYVDIYTTVHTHACYVYYTLVTRYSKPRMSRISQHKPII